MENIAQDLISDSLAQSSQRAYASAQQSFLQLCTSLKIPALPATEQVLLLFVADLSQRVCHSTVRSYLAAVRHLHLSRGFPDPLKGCPRVDLALKGLRRRKPRSGDSRLPITPLILSTLGRVWAQPPVMYEDLMLWAACCLGFFAFMRSGELTLPSGTTFNPSLHLCPADIAVDNSRTPTTLRVHLKTSKTDQMRTGTDLYLGRTFNALCPVVAMLKYLAVRGFEEGPLFRFENGTPLTRPVFVSKIRQTLQQAGMDPTRYAGHSFRIGAATTAAAQGVSDATIQLLGRWRSDSYVRYVRTPRQELAYMTRLLTQESLRFCSGVSLYLTNYV